MNLCIRKQAKSNLVTWNCLHITTSCQFKYVFQKWQLTAGFYTLKAQLISSDIPFESTHFDSVKIRWDFMAKDSEANSKEWNNGLLMLSWATTIYTYPFVLKVSIKLQRIIIAHTVVEVYGFISLSQNFFNLDTYFSKRRVLRTAKRDLEREISTTVDRDWIFFLAKVSKYKASHWRIFFSIKLYKPFYKIISWNYELRKFWSIDFSSCFDFRYFPVSRESSCDASRCELTIRNLRSGAILAVLIHSL